MMTVISTILSIAKAVPIVDSWIRALIAAYLSTMTSKTLSMISDTAAMAARAQTDEDRYKSAEAWQKTLSRPRALS